MLVSSDDFSISINSELNELEEERFASSPIAFSIVSRMTSSIRLPCESDEDAIDPAVIIDLPTQNTTPSDLRLENQRYWQTDRFDPAVRQTSAHWYG
jgi:hypothetical protein